MTVFATIGGLALVLRHDPLTGLGLPAEASAAARSRTESPGGTGADPSPGIRPGVPAVAVRGRPATTVYGSVQVEVTVQDRRVVAARAVRTPEDGGQTGRRINARAMPILSGEAVRAQSAQIDAVSGATISSTGYKQSLQSALDAAHLV